MKITFGSAFIKTDATTTPNNQKIGLFIQFDNGEEKEVMQGHGEDMEIKLFPETGWIEFSETETGKKFKMTCRLIP